MVWLAQEDDLAFLKDKAANVNMDMKHLPSLAKAREGIFFPRATSWYKEITHGQ